VLAPPTGGGIASTAELERERLRHVGRVSVFRRDVESASPACELARYPAIGELVRLEAGELRPRTLAIAREDSRLRPHEGDRARFGRSAASCPMASASSSGGQTSGSPRRARRSPSAIRAVARTTYALVPISMTTVASAATSSHAAFGRAIQLRHARR
jgi:hypothetical protein